MNLWADTAAAILNAKEAAKGCVCKGECPCHFLLQHGAQPCPPDCTTSGFDVCHLCYCQNPAAKKGKTA